MHVKMIQMTEELDSVGASLMRLPDVVINLIRVFLCSRTINLSKQIC